MKSWWSVLAVLLVALALFEQGVVRVACQIDPTAEPTNTTDGSTTPPESSTTSLPDTGPTDSSISQTETTSGPTGSSTPITGSTTGGSTLNTTSTSTSTSTTTTTTTPTTTTSSTSTTPTTTTTTPSQGLSTWAIVGISAGGVAGVAAVGGGVGFAVWKFILNKPKVTPTEDVPLA